jgi:hypothetical protein
MVFSRARRPAFTITTNGETGILQIVQEILLVAAHKAIPGERHGSSLSVWRRSCTPRLFPAISEKELNEIYTPTADEFDLAHSLTNSTAMRIGFLVLLKTFQLRIRSQHLTERSLLKQ